MASLAECWSAHLYQNMKAAKYEVKMYVRKCRARQERKVIHSKDEMFKNKDERRFKKRFPAASLLLMEDLSLRKMIAKKVGRTTSQIWLRIKRATQTS